MPSHKKNLLSHLKTHLFVNPEQSSLNDTSRIIRVSLENNQDGFETQNYPPKINGPVKLYWYTGSRT